MQLMRTVPVDKTLDKDKVLDKRNLKIVPGFTDARCWVFLMLFVYYISLGCHLKLLTDASNLIL